MKAGLGVRLVAGAAFLAGALAATFFAGAAAFLAGAALVAGAAFLAGAAAFLAGGEIPLVGSGFAAEKRCVYS